MRRRLAGIAVNEVCDTEESLQGFIDPWGEVCETEDRLQGKLILGMKCVIEKYV